MLARTSPFAQCCAITLRRRGDPSCLIRLRQEFLDHSTIQSIFRIGGTGDLRRFEQQQLRNRQRHRELTDEPGRAGDRRRRELDVSSRQDPRKNAINGDGSQDIALCPNRMEILLVNPDRAPHTGENFGGRLKGPVLFLGKPERT